MYIKFYLFFYNQSLSIFEIDNTISCPGLVKSPRGFTPGCIPSGRSFLQYKVTFSEENECYLSKSLFLDILLALINGFF